MQGIVFDVKRFAVHDGPGIRTTIFFKGCNMRCFWCHNPESFDAKPQTLTKKLLLDGVSFDRTETIGQPMTVAEVMAVIERERIFMDESGGGVTLSGGEPTLQPQFLLELLLACKSKGIHTAVDTNGSATEELYQAILPFTDLFLFDLKHTNASKHQLGTKTANQRILRNLALLLEMGACVRVRVPVVPTFNHSVADMREMADFLSTLPRGIEQVDLLPYHQLGKGKFERLGLPVPLTSEKGLTKHDLIPYRELFEQKGFCTTIGG